MGFVFQQFNLLDEYTVLNNILMPLKLDGKKPDKQFLEEITALLGIADKLKKYPGELSGGQQQRVAIARAIVNNPKILLADEPTGALDSQSGAQIMELFQTLNDEGVTVVMITHDIDVANHAKRVLHIRDGQFAEQHIPEEKEAEA